VRLVVVGNPDNRRVRLFDAAARAAGLAAPAVVTWRDVAGGRVEIPDQHVVRIDSPGEDGAVDRLLRCAPAAAEHGEIVGRATWYAGFSAALRRVAATGAPLLNQVHDMMTMFDKRRCHAALAAAGVPVPPVLPCDGGYELIRAHARAAGWSRVFVKPVHGSSASGVVALAFGAAGRVCGYTSAERDGGRLFNALRVHRYDSEAEIAAIVDALAVDGLHVERWLPKATFGGRAIDLRVVVIAGRPGHVVVRTSRSPMTNLHLGNARGDLPSVRAAVGGDRWAQMLATCVRAAACFRGSLHAGVDLLISPGFDQHAVAEVNAFGDLLPGVVVDGRDTYAEQIDALLSGRFSAWSNASGSASSRAERAA
jgi:glutathione synthase/RimK-type ligase-like ATP-grasp enzyme